MYTQLHSENADFYTSDYVLDETFTLFFKRLHFEAAKSSMELLNQAISTGQLHLISITTDRFRQTQTLRLKYQDKPNISFTDFSSMVVMVELDIETILTADRHFTHVGMGFQTIPE